MNTGMTSSIRDVSVTCYPFGIDWLIWLITPKWLPRPSSSNVTLQHIIIFLPSQDSTTHGSFNHIHMHTYIRQCKSMLRLTIIRIMKCLVNYNWPSSTLTSLYSLPVVNGGWSAWSLTGVCSATCGGGEQRYERRCNNPTPKNGGLQCAGLDHKFEPCNTQCCAGDPCYTKIIIVFLYIIL